MPKEPSTIEEGLPLIVWYVAAAERVLHVQKTSLAVLLLYASVERYTGLCLRVEHDLNDENPDYSPIRQRLDWTCSIKQVGS
jgi:hypothetical protein